MPLKKHEAEKLIEVIKGFVDETKPAADEHARINFKPGAVKSNGQEATPAEIRAAFPAAGAAFDEEALYQRFRARIIDDAQIDPVLLKLIAVQPELIVEYERRSETLDSSTIRGRIAKLIAQGFIDEKRTTGQVRSELARTGSDVNSGGLSTALGALLSAGFLVRSGDGWQRAPGIKVREKEIEARV